ncbi:hypothetical protein ACWEL8_01645 [Streptomyces sp. NPDC004690]
MFKRDQGERDARKRDRAAVKAHIQHPTYPYNPDYAPDKGDSPDKEMLPAPKFESRRYRRRYGQ